MLGRKSKWSRETESTKRVLFQKGWPGKAVLSDKAISNWRPTRGVRISRKNNPVSRRSKCKGPVV